MRQVQESSICWCHLKTVQCSVQLTANYVMHVHIVAANFPMKWFLCLRWTAKLVIRSRQHRQFFVLFCFSREASACLHTATVRLIVCVRRVRVLCVFVCSKWCPARQWALEETLLCYRQLNSAPVGCRLPPARQTLVQTCAMHTRVNTHAHTHARGAEMTGSRHCSRERWGSNTTLPHRGGWWPFSTTQPLLATISRHFIPSQKKTPYRSTSSLRLPRGPWQTPLLWQEVPLFSLLHADNTIAKKSSLSSRMSFRYPEICPSIHHPSFICPSCLNKTQHKRRRIL